MGQVILTQISNGVQTITMNRPEAMNVLSLEMIAGFNKALTASKIDPDIKVIVLQGAGENFMAGGDISYFKNIIDDKNIDRVEHLESLVSDAQKIVACIQQIDKPVISLVRGVAVGFGLSLVMASDFAIAAKNCTFSTAYCGIGLSPDGGASFSLPRMLGLKKAKELLMLCDRFDSAEALQLGILTYVVDEDELDMLLDKLTNALCNSASVALAHVKNLVNTSIETNLVDQLEREKDAFIECALTQDFEIGINSFLAKKKPKFMGK
jgi:2-(1,2-epoxy-1,2-dihydrophenyl)acetyl-CoA isomerase